MKTQIPYKILLFFLSISFWSQAQEISLDPVTITAGIVERRASESGRNIAVIKGEFLKDMPANSIDELLRYIPAVEIQARGPMGSQSDIVLRGGTFQQVLVVLDGIRLNDPNTGHFNSYIPIASTEIERIEVLKGAASALYGSEAVGGVIHIITKAFAAKLDRDSDPEHRNDYQVQGQVGIGEYGLKNALLGGYLNTGRLALAGGLQSNNARGVQQRGTRGFFHNNTISLSAQYALAPHWSLSVRSSYDHRDFGAQNFYTVFASDTASEKVRSNWNHAKLKYQSHKNTITLDGGYKRVKDQYLYNPSSLANESTSELWQGLLLWQHDLNDKISIVSGLNYQNKQISSNDRGEHSLHQLAPLFTLTARMDEYLTLNPTLRLDWRQNLGTELIPQLNVSYKRNNWQFRASAGKTIRDADFTERYNNYGKKLVTGGSVGNPDLKAERSFSYEAGFDWFAGMRLKLSSTYFQRIQTDLIDYVTTPYANMPRKDNLSPSGIFGLTTNIAEVTTSGVETDLQYNPDLGENQRLWLTLGLTWLNSNSDSQEPSFYITSHAKFLSNFAAIYQIGNLSLSMTGLYKVRNPRQASAIEASVSRSYFVLNSKAEFSFFEQKLKIFVQADNILNKKYSDLLGAQMPGLWMSTGIRAYFKQ
ncbi:TonB-dependent receptor plug domain-containing protein [Dyadobacter tibetensis]|uniref:TonB-dependent receptor plug domain-containing protein n=1 Tax=Dyadobacter tibetensis TaxID=1211851 RepID=UPI00046EFA25|nr:TonB-dependent receptor [Dyadobacter tibetensis]